MPIRLKLPRAEEPNGRGYLYRRVSMYGAGELSDAELLAAVLSGDHARRRALAECLLAEVGSLWGIARLGIAPLRDIGLGPCETARLKACIELGRRSAVGPMPRSAVREPRDAYRCVARRLAACERERFVVVVLDVKNRPRHVSTVFEGSVDACPIDPREIFAPAVRERGTAILVAHNHPSGDPTPSKEDLILTDRLVEAGSLIGIPVLDHIIVGHHPDGSARYVSLAERGLITTNAGADGA
ncbi:MAG: DNA repair protein RadC [Myxococcota bacterium]